MQDLPSSSCGLQYFAADNQLTVKPWEKAAQELGKCKTWFQIMIQAKSIMIDIED